MIHRNTTLDELGALVCQSLKNAGIDSFLSGGAVVSIYSDNAYESYDLDFVTFGDRRKIKAVMEKLGFNQDRSRLFRHPESIYLVEFPGTALQIGDEPIQTFAERKIGENTLKLLTPTDCVKDLLASYIHWKDRQALDQAALVAHDQPCNLSSIKEFCKNEGSAQTYTDFAERLNELKSVASPKS